MNSLSLKKKKYLTSRRLFEKRSLRRETESLVGASQWAQLGQVVGALISFIVFPVPQPAWLFP
jgi:hypothetical protein